MAMRYRDLGDTIVEALNGFPGLEGVDLDALAQAVLRHVEVVSKPADDTGRKERG